MGRGWGIRVEAGANPACRSPSSLPGSLLAGRRLPSQPLPSPHATSIVCPESRALQCLRRSVPALPCISHQQTITSLLLN